MDRRILVTGGAGFIGSNLAASLLRDGYHVTIFDALCGVARSTIWPGFATRTTMAGFISCRAMYGITGPCELRRAAPT